MKQQQNNPGPNYRQELLGIIDGVLLKHRDDDLTMAEIAEEVGPFLPASHKAYITERAIQEYVGRQMRAAKILSPSGDQVRKYGCYEVRKNANGQETRVFAWREWQYMSSTQIRKGIEHLIRKHRENAFAIKMQVDYVNTIQNSKNRKPIEFDASDLNVDFDDDAASEAA